MKRVFSLIIMVLYLLPAFGMTVSTHYCGGKLADVSLFGSKAKMNCACGTPAPANKVFAKRKCCEQIIYSLKLEDQQIKEPVINFKNPDSGFPQLESFHCCFYTFTVNGQPETVVIYSPDLPPGRYNTPIYIQNDSFLI